MVDNISGQLEWSIHPAHTTVCNHSMPQVTGVVTPTEIGDDFSSAGSYGYSGAVHTV